MQDGELHQPIGCIIVDIAFPGAHRIGQFVGSDGHKARRLDRAARRANPVGNATVLAGCLVLPAHPGKQYRVRAADYPLRDRQGRQQLLGLAHGGAVVEHLLDILATSRWYHLLPGLKLQHLAHRCLGAFNARRQHGFLRTQRGEQHTGIGHSRQHPVVAGHSRRRWAEKRDQTRPVDLSRREAPFVVLDRCHQAPSTANIRRWKSSSMSRTFHRSSGVLRFSRLLPPLT